MTFNFDNPLIRERAYSGQFGLERETLRVDASGALAQTAHPFGEDESITRDFCENQVEIITPPEESPAAVVRSLGALHARAVRQLLPRNEGAEYLWPFSNPPRISGEDEIPIARFAGNLTPKMTYRQYLAQKYGKRKMLFCGIHCNFSFDDELLKAGFEESGEEDFTRYKNAVYLSLAGRLAEYGWLIVYLTAASSVSDPSLFDDASAGGQYASARCGDRGYWNSFVPVFDYTDIEAYTESIWRYIKEGAIVSPSELYYPIRLKPKGENRLDHLRDNGVNHIELRMLDVNPLTPEGIFEKDIAFIQLLILYLMSSEDGAPDENAQKIAVRNFQQAARYDDGAVTVLNPDVPGSAQGIKEAAAEILSDMRVFFVSLSASEEVFDVLAYQENKLLDEQNRYAVKIREIYGDNFTEKGLALAKQYAEKVMTQAI